MRNIIYVLLTASILFNSAYNGSTTSAVAIVGGIIKSTHIDHPDIKYKRKNCPVCKGTGKYLSGDGIKMVDCGYCEPEKPNKDTELLHPPIILYGNPQPKCTGPNCKVRK